MKYRILFLSVLCVLSLGVNAQCLLAFQDAENNFNAGKYEQAKQGFQWCQRHCEDISATNLQKWITKCDNKIAAQRSARIAKQQQLAAEREKRIKDKLVYVSCDALLFDAQYTALSGTVKKMIVKEGFQLTNDRSKAYYEVYISAFARKEIEYKLQNQVFTGVEAYIVVNNAIDQMTLLETDIYERQGSMNMDYTYAGRWVYTNVMPDRIIEEIKLYLEK